MFGSSEIMSFLPLLLIFGVFYFLMIRPQQKKMKVHQDMLAGLKRGDKVITSGGIIGTIVKVINDQEVHLEIAENVRVRVVRNLITDIVAKTEPANTDKGSRPSKTENQSAAE